MESSKEHDITVINRGTYSMEQFGVKQIQGDRREASLWEQVTEDFDCIVDFCGYNQGDIEIVFSNMKGKIGQYILISTVDVYERGILGYKKEETPFEERVFPGEAGTYISGKVKLEKELREQCKQNDVAFTVLRPAVIYGPFNYAPRESVLIRLMVEQHLLPRITDADGLFQLVYVKDVANAIMTCITNEQTYGKAYNICGDEVVNYKLFEDCLLSGAKSVMDDTTFSEIQEIAMTVEEAESKGIPIAFPVSKEETELYCNEKSKEELGIRYHSLEEGMRRTYQAFWNVFRVTESN